jgi:hypothetical protein
MTAVEKYFFTPLYYPHTAWSVLGWWEARRPLFNLCVGSAGAVSLAACALFAQLPPHPAVVSVPWLGVVAYGVLANLCYTLGPVTDLLLRRRLGGRAPAIGPVLLRYGFVFSVGLSLLPVAVGGLGWLARVLVSLR